MQNKIDEDYYMLIAMDTYGGSFVQYLAKLLRTADHINYAKLENAFPEYFAQYRKMGEEERARTIKDQKHGDSNNG